MHRTMHSTPSSTVAANPHANQPQQAHVNLQKQRKGWSRIWHAGIYALQGLHAAWYEKAFRLEVVLAVPLLPLAFWVGTNWLEIMALIASMGLVLVVELLNSAIETVVDRVGLEWHALAKKAKDLASAAVLLSLLLCLGTWCAAIAARIQ